MAGSADAATLVKRLYDAFNDPGFLGLGGTDEDGVFAALKQARDQGNMREVDALYHKTYPDEPTLRAELDDELSGDDLTKAVGYYDEGMKGPAAKAPVAAAPGSLKNACCDGTLTPKARNWPDDVLATLTALQRKIEGGSKPTFGSPAEKFTHFDQDNWSQNLNDVTRGHSVAFSPITAPYAAVGALFDNLEKWTLDCATYAEVALLLAWRRYSGSEAAFNKRFSGLILRNQHSAGLPMQTAVVQPDEASQAAGFNAAWDAAPPGTKISWKNMSKTVFGTAWEHEFGIKRRSDGSAAGTTYDAFPLGCDLSEDAVKRSLAEQASDFPMRYTLSQSAVDEVEAEEVRLKPLHTAMAQSIPVPPTDRIPPEVFRNLKDNVVGNTYAGYGEFLHALGRAKVPPGFVETFKGQASKSADPALADAYVKKNIFRYDFSRPVL
ncbi:MAG: hypothetical protein JF616_06525 [Fibrobacteres bacterium]|nr:hypothetical protein [Fibrobacterota bacterium]